MTALIRKLRAWFKRGEQQGMAQAPPSTPAEVKPDLPPNLRSIRWKGLELRSVSELKIAQALDRAGVWFVAGVVARFNVERGERAHREVDFLICADGRWGILEVDGPYHSAAHDRWRDDLFAAHGIRLIARYPSEVCHEQPKQVVAEFLNRLRDSG